MLKILKLMQSLSQLLIQTCLGENVQRPRQNWRRRQGIGSRPRTEHQVLDIQLMWQNGLHPNPARLKLQASLPCQQLTTKAPRKDAPEKSHKNYALVALWEIHHFQKSMNLLIPLLPFQCLIHEITQDF